MQTNSNTLNVENPMDLLLVLLYAPQDESSGESQPIEGITRLQKLMFLLQKGKGPKSIVKQARQLDYKSYKMGPFSNQLRTDIEELKSAGLIRTVQLQYVISDDGIEYDNELKDASVYDLDNPRPRHIQSERFSLSNFGREVAEDMWKGLKSSDKKELREFKEFFNSITLRQLLIFVYENYPDYTDRSEIKKQLGLS
ncbi:MAG: hypothetical protein P9X24_07580 [Candidatus Hatepunaea meridiana]|nr:hypothetical protein [Candidatus Hatepunaea meridiana]